MANNQPIDSLSIDIEISGLKKSDITRLEDLSNALSNLNKILTPQLITNLNNLGKPIQKLVGLGSIGSLNLFFKSFTSNKAIAIKETSKSLGHLDKTISTSFISRLQKLAQINLGFKNLKGLKKFLKKYNQKLDQVNNPKKGKEKEPQKEKVQINEKEQITQRKFNLLNKIGRLQKSLKDNLSNIPILNALLGLTASTNKKDKEKKEEEKRKKSLNKFIASFKRIALYRLIRTIIASITQAVKEGMENLAKYDMNFNKSMSSIVTSIQNIKNSIGLMAQTFIEGLAPVLEQVSILFTNIANEVSRINAMQKGITEYTKINAEYTKNYANSLAKASGFAFDTFNVLSGGTGSMYETANVNDVSEQNANIISSMYIDAFMSIKNAVVNMITFLKPFVEGFLTVFSPIIWIASKINEGVSWLLANIPFLGEILGGLTAIIVALNIATSMNPIGWLIIGLTVLIGLIGLLVKAIVENWSSIVEFLGNAVRAIGNVCVTIVNAVINAIEIMINGVVAGINFLLDGVNQLGNFFGADWNLQLSRAEYGRLEYFADGGIASAGSLFVAGEAGAELLTNMGGGNTGVTNVEQFENAMTRAIISSGLLQAVEDSGNIYMDSEIVGKKIGQSRSLRNQLNRTNPSLKLR